MNLSWPFSLLANSLVQLTQDFCPWSIDRDKSKLHRTWFFLFSIYFLMSFFFYSYKIKESQLPKVLSFFSSVQSQSCPTLCDPMNRSTPGLPVHHQLLEFTQTHIHRVSDAIQPSHPLSSPSPPAPNLSQHQGLFKSALHIRWPKYWSFSFNVSPSNEHPGRISFRMDWLYLQRINHSSAVEY